MAQTTSDLLKAVVIYILLFVFGLCMIDECYSAEVPENAELIWTKNVGRSKISKLCIEGHVFYLTIDRRGRTNLTQIWAGERPRTCKKENR